MRESAFSRGLGLLACMASLLLVGSAPTWAEEATVPSEGPGIEGSEELVRKGRIELSTAAFVSWSDGIDDVGDDERLRLLNIPLRVGYILGRGFGLEGELLLSNAAYDGDDETGTIFTGNLTYHFKTDGRVVPFLLAGGGYGNAAEFLSIAADLDTGIGVVQGGAGIKAFFGRRAALRAEYRFTRYSGEDDRFRFRREIELNNHKVFVGVSLWFR